MTMRLARPAPLQVVVERAIGARARRTCPAPSATGDAPTRFRPAATVQAPSAAAVARRLTLRLRLAPGLYRITVRAQLEDESLSRPVRGIVRVLK
jgi:hypothetical protein